MNNSSYINALKNNTLLKGFNRKCKFTSIIEAKKIIPLKNAQSNKGDYGKLLCIAGSREMTGAAVLSASAAVKSGAGLVTVAAPKSIISVIQSHLLESVFMPLTENYLGSISLTSIDTLIQNTYNSTACMVGCGLGDNVVTGSIIEELIDKTKLPLIIDADALNGIAKNKSILSNSRGNMILTPHPGEMARLCGTSVSKVQSSRINFARNFAKIHNVIMVLKGAYTIIADPTGEVNINPTGNPGMAKGGSGDVLTGIISSFVAQGMGLREAAVAGVFIHGMSADIAAKENSVYAMTPSDIVDSLGKAFLKIIKV